MQIYNDINGLDEDYLNAWTGINYLHSAFKSGIFPENIFLTILSEPIDTYELYFEKYYPEKVQEAMQRADPEAVRSIDELVEKYNKLSIDKKRNMSVYSDYFNECYAIIKGIILPENTQSETVQQPGNNN